MSFDRFRAWLNIASGAMAVILGIHEELWLCAFSGVLLMLSGYLLLRG